MIHDSQQLAGFPHICAILKHQMHPHHIIHMYIIALTCFTVPTSVFHITCIHNLPLYMYMAVDAILSVSA
jgi:hypothetical protein